MSCRKLAPIFWTLKSFSRKHFWLNTAHSLVQLSFWCHWSSMRSIRRSTRSIPECSSSVEPSNSCSGHLWGFFRENHMDQGGRRKLKKCPPEGTLQPEIIAELIPKTLFHVTEMRFSKKLIPKQCFHVILWVANEYVICNFREINSRKILLVTEM